MDARQLEPNPLQTLLSTEPFSTMTGLRVAKLLGEQSATDLLAMMPAAVKNSIDHRLTAELIAEQKKQSQQDYERARSAILRVQQTVKENNLSEKFETFSNLEGGILALMLGRLDHLDIPSTKRLLPDSDNPLPSIMEEQEIEKLGLARIEAIVNKISAHYRRTNKHKESDLKYLNILAILILRATDDERLQAFLVDIHCTSVNENTLGSHMQSLRAYAVANQHQYILNLLDILEKEKDEVMIEATVDYWLAQSGSLNKPQPDTANSLLVNPKLLIPYAGNYDGPDNYMLWSLVMLYQSWEKAFEVIKTLHAHVSVSLAVRNETAETHRNKFFRDDHNQYFVNLSGLVIKSFVPSAWMLEVVDHRTSFYAADFSDSTLNCFLDHQPMGRSFQNDLTLNSCRMDGVKFKGRSIASVNFKKMQFIRVDAEGTQFMNCEFDNICFAASEFKGASISSSVFRNCTFHVSTSLTELTFQRQIQDGDVKTCFPVIFDKCTFDSADLSNAAHTSNARFIDCEFGTQTKLPEGSICYQTTRKNGESIEGMYELFKQVEKANDLDLLQYLQDRLLFKLRIGRKLPIRDYLYCLEIFRNDQDKSEAFEQLRVYADFSVNTAYSVNAAYILFNDLKHAGDNGMISLLQHHFAKYLDQDYVRSFIILEECMTCEEIFSTDEQAKMKFFTLKLRAFDTIQEAYDIYQRVANEGNVKKIKCLQDQLIKCLKYSGLKAVTKNEDAQCREIFGCRLSYGYRLFDAMTSLVYDPPALQSYKAMQLEEKESGLRNHRFQ